MFYSLNFLKPVHVQNVHLLPQHTPNNDVELRDIPSGLLLMAISLQAGSIWSLTSIFELAKFDEHWSSRYQSYEKIALTTLGIVQKPAWLHQHSRYQWNFTFFRTDLSTQLAAFHRLQTCLGLLLLLPFLMVVYQIQPPNVIELQQHSPRSNNTSVTTYVDRMIISPPCLIKHMKND